MSQGWSDISISIKSEKLAKLLRDHGITPKGAGNVKNGITYDVDFEWDYTSRYEYMAYDITDVGELIFYYISCVLAVENGKKLEKLEKAYLQNADTIKNSVECAYYSATVHWDIVAYGEESYEFQLEPYTLNAEKGTTIFSDLQAVPPSFDNRILLLGEFAFSQDIKAVSAELTARGWHCCGIFDEHFAQYLHRIESIQKPSPDLRQCRFVVVGDKTTSASFGQLLRCALQQQKKEKFFIVREKDFFAQGVYQQPSFEPIHTIDGKTVLIYNAHEELIKNTVLCGATPIQQYRNNVDICVLPNLENYYGDEYRKSFYSFETTGKPICFTKEQYLALLNQVDKPSKKSILDTAPQMTGDWSGKVFVVNGFAGGIRKKITEGIVNHGGEISATVNKTVDCLVCGDKWANNSIVKRAHELQASSGKIVIADEQEFFDLLATVHSKRKAEEVPTGELTGKTFVLANYDEHKKALATMKKFITDNGGVIRTSVSGKTDFVVCKHFGMLKWSEYRIVGGKRVEIVHEHESKKVQEAKQLQETGAKVELISEEDFMARFG